MASSTPLRSITKPRESNITTASNGNSSSHGLASLDAPKINQRGHNKPKCIKCGNVARSRCPFQSCKNCCANAQNPCHIHVLKQSSILPAPTTPPPPPPPTTTKATTTTTTAVVPEPSPEVLSARASWRLSTLKRYSNYVHLMRTKRPLTRKDAMNMNRHRFSKLKEHMEGEIEAENEGFDRYMWNVALVEETFCTNNKSGEVDPDDHKNSLSCTRMRLIANDDVANNQRQRTQTLIDRLLRKLHESDSVSDDVSAHDGAVRFSSLVEKLGKARTEDDVKVCLELKENLMGSTSMASDAEYCLPKMCTAVDVDEEALAAMDVELSSLGRLAEL